MSGLPSFPRAAGEAARFSQPGILVVKSRSLITWSLIRKRSKTSYKEKEIGESLLHVHIYLPNEGNS